MTSNRSKSVILLLALFSSAECFAPSLNFQSRRNDNVPLFAENDDTKLQNDGRRAFFKTAATGILSLGVLSSKELSSPAYAAPPKEANVFADKMSKEDAKKRFVAARSDLKYLLENYGEIAKGGGDSVRNYLGTQGVSSNMYGIQKVLKMLQDESDDIVEYTETMEEFNAYLYQAEGAAYQSLFAEHSSSRSTPESLLATAKQDVTQMVKYMDTLAVQLNL